MVLTAGCGGDIEPGPFVAKVHEAQVGRTTIAWYDRGQGTPLVMLMGTGSTMAEWDPALLELLSRRHRLIMLDFPGVGRSGPWRGDSFDFLADTTASFLEVIGVDHADILGWSMGGFVAQRLAVGHPELVSHLILAGTNPGGNHSALGTREAQAIDSDPDPTDAEILQELYPPDRQEDGRRFLDRLVSASRSGEIPDDFDVPRATTDAQVAAEGPWLRSNGNYDELAGIAAPTLAAAGKQDPVVPPQNLEAIAERIPGAELEVFPGAHAFLFQDRAAFTRAVDDFLGSPGP